MHLYSIGNVHLKNTYPYILLHCDRTNLDENASEPIMTRIIGQLQNRTSFEKKTFDRAINLNVLDSHQNFPILHNQSNIKQRF